MKRKLGKKNMLLFVLFSFLALLIVALFGYGIYTAITIDKNIYSVASGSFTYDLDNNYVKLESNGELKQKYDKNYYLSVKDDSSNKVKVTNLGNDFVIYNENDMFLKVYGTNYQVDLNGVVTYNDGELEVSKNSSSLFYKLDDRKYLIISKSIYTEKKEINTSNYLIIEIDKSGNALLLNNELNVKALSTIKLKTAGYEFDVANEKLIIPNSKRVIDLKKINGSSNEYVEPKKEEKVEEKDTDKENNNNQVNNNNNNNNQNNYVNNNTNNSGATSGSAASTIISNSTNNSQQLNIVKSAIVTSAISSTSYIDVLYNVSDPKGEYVSVFLDVTGYDGTTNRIVLNKDLTRYRIRGLKANSEYSINFGYNYISSENEDLVLEDIASSFVVKTNKNQTKINITKISGRKIYYNVVFDPSYSYETATAVVYSDNFAIGRDQVNVLEANRNGGYNGVVECDNDFGYQIVIKLEDCKYDGEMVESNIQTKFING